MELDMRFFTTALVLVCLPHAAMTYYEAVEKPGQSARSTRTYREMTDDQRQETLEMLQGTIFGLDLTEAREVLDALNRALFAGLIPTKLPEWIERADFVELFNDLVGEDE